MQDRSPSLARVTHEIEGRPRVRISPAVRSAEGPVSWIRFHPLTRIIIVAATVVGLALVAGVERVGDALASMTPGGSFDDRCARLPNAGVHVSLLPFSVVENTTTPFATLTRMSDDPAATHRTIGLTHASFAHRSSIEVKGLEDRASHRA